ncbi:hypothetical protein AB0F17_42890 [Nonomuraea sp. NPDC026600]|uniref:hypothetical protein n=1 Tax=Nonomuraea sp. NPDC026600 TaxID=3155363 RepID=UPI003404221E
MTAPAHVLNLVRPSVPSERNLQPEEDTMHDNNTPQPLPVTEDELAEQHAVEAARQREEWPSLHDVADGGTVDLSSLWPRMEPERWDIDPAAVVELLAERAGGVANRLDAGVRSLLARRDGNTSVWIRPKPEEDLIEVVAWSAGGVWSQRAWWIRGILEVAADGYGEIRMSPFCATTFAIRGSGGTTVFTEDENGLIGRLLGRWYLGWLGRRAVREQLGYEPIGPEETALDMEEFLSPAPSGRTFTLTIVEGEQQHANGIDLSDADSPVSYTDLPDDVQQWLTDRGYVPERPDVWVLVTPVDELPEAVNVIDVWDVTV